MGSSPGQRTCSISRLCWRGFLVSFYLSFVRVLTQPLIALGPDLCLHRLRAYINDYYRNEHLSLRWLKVRKYR